MILRLTLLLLLCPSLAWAACTGSSPNLTATDSAGLVTCLANAVRGDTITVNAGTTYTGQFELKDLGAGTTPVIVQSSDMASLPAGVRVTASQASHMPTIVPASPGTFAIITRTDASYWTLRGLNITTPASWFASGFNTTFLVYDGDEYPYGHWPHHITIDRCLIHPADTDPDPIRTAEHGVGINGANIAITNSAIYNLFGYPNSLTFDATVTGATNASPVQITLDLSIADPGHKVLMFFQGGTGAWGTALNGYKLATWVDATHWTLQNYDASFNLSNIDTTSAGAFGAQVVTRRDLQIGNTIAITITVGPGPYLIQNNLLEAYYGAMFTGGAATAWIDPANVVSVTAAADTTHVTLSGVGNLQVGDLIAFERPATQTITSVSKANPAVMTVQAHSFPAGTHLYSVSLGGYLTLAGFSGDWAALNGNKLGIVVDSTRIALYDPAGFSSPIDSTGFTGASGAGTFTAHSDAATAQWTVGHVTGISGLNITYEWWGHQPQNTDGTGAGFLIDVGSAAQFNGLTLGDLTVTRNTIQIRRDWLWLLEHIAKTCDACGPANKAIWESKLANRVLFEGNIVQVLGGSTSPFTGPLGLAINTVQQRGNTPWTTNSDWIIRSNLWLNIVAQKFSLLDEYFSGAVSQNVTFTNNLLTASKTAWLSLEGGEYATITHNTARNISGGAFDGYGFRVSQPNLFTTVKDNIFNAYLYGMQVDASAAPWTPTANTTNFGIDNSGVPAQNCGDTMGSPNTCLTVSGNAAASLALMKFVDVASADAGGDYHGYRLAADSPGHNAATDGTDVGVNFTTLDAALGTALTGLSGNAALSGHGSLHQ